MAIDCWFMEFTTCMVWITDGLGIKFGWLKCLCFHASQWLERISGRKFGSGQRHDTGQAEMAGRGPQRFSWGRLGGATAGGIPPWMGELRLRSPIRENWHPNSVFFSRFTFRMKSKIVPNIFSTGLVQTAHNMQAVAAVRSLGFAVSSFSLYHRGNHGNVMNMHWDLENCRPVRWASDSATPLCRGKSRWT